MGISEPIVFEGIDHVQLAAPRGSEAAGRRFFGELGQCREGKLSVGGMVLHQLDRAPCESRVFDRRLEPASETAERGRQSGDRRHQTSG